MADPAYIWITDPATGQMVMVDPLTGQPVTLDTRTGQPLNTAPIYDPASRHPDSRQAIAAQYPTGSTFIPPDLGRVAVDESGRVRPDLTPFLPAPAQESTAAGLPPAGGGAPSSGYSDSSYGGYSSAYRSRGSSYDRGYGGQMPRASAQMPGGGDSGYGPAHTVYLQTRPLGRSYHENAGTLSAGGSYPGMPGPPPRPGSAGRGGQASGFGGGGNSNPRYQALYAKGQAMAAKVRGMASNLRYGGGGGSSYGGSSSYSYPDYTEPNYKGPDDPAIQKRLERFNELLSSRRSTLSHPEFAIPGSINLESPFGQRMMDLPGTDLALMAGAGRKNWKGGVDPTEDIYTDYYEKLNKNLSHGGKGIDFLPFYKKQMRKDPGIGQYSSTLQNLYNRVAGGYAVDTDMLFRNLTHARKGTYLGDQFRDKAAGTAADQFLRSFGSLTRAGEYGDIQRGGLNLLANEAVTQYGQRFAGRDPRRVPDLNTWVGARLRGYV